MSIVHSQADSTLHSGNNEQTLQIPAESWQGSLDGCEASLRYLKGTRELGLTFLRDADGLQLFGACDADWASDVDDRRSTTGFAFMVQKEGAAISWNSKKQPTAAISSSEAEYQAMAAAVQEVLYLRSLLEEMGVKSEGATVIQEDNQSCIKMCKNPVMQKRTKHIDIKHHFVRERVEDGELFVHFIHKH